MSDTLKDIITQVLEKEFVDGVYPDNSDARIIYEEDLPEVVDKVVSALGSFQDEPRFKIKHLAQIYKHKSDAKKDNDVLHAAYHHIGQGLLKALSIIEGRKISLK